MSSCAYTSLLDRLVVCSIVITTNVSDRPYALETTHTSTALQGLWSSSGFKFSFHRFAH